MNTKINDTERTIFLIISIIIIMIGIISLSFTIKNFYVGYHNADLGQNLRWINAKYNLNLVDYSNKYQINDAQTLFQKGINLMDISFMKGIYFSFLTFFGIFLLYFYGRKV